MMLAAILTVGQFVAEIAKQEGMRPEQLAPVATWSAPLTHGDAVSIAKQLGLDVTTTTPRWPLGRLGADWIEHEIHERRHPASWQQPQQGKKPKAKSTDEPE